VWSSTSLKIYNFNINNKTFVIILLLDRSPRFQGDRRFGSVSTFGNHFVRQFDRRVSFIIGIVFLLERILKCRYNSFLKFSSAKFSSYFSKFWNVATFFFFYFFMHLLRIWNVPFQMSDSAQNYVFLSCVKNKLSNCIFGLI
jgi:hypothetical protein